MLEVVGASSRWTHGQSMNIPPYEAALSRIQSQFTFGGLSFIIRYMLTYPPYTQYKANIKHILHYIMPAKHNLRVCIGEFIRLMQLCCIFLVGISRLLCKQNIELSKIYFKKNMKIIFTLGRTFEAF